MTNGRQPWLNESPVAGQHLIGCDKGLPNMRSTHGKSDLPFQRKLTPYDRSHDGWRKYEWADLHPWETGSGTKADIRKWMTCHTHQRPHSALRGRLRRWSTGRAMISTNPISKCNG